MDELKRQVRVARRRLILQRFLAVFGWSLFATLLVAAVGLAIPKIWVLTFDPRVWAWAWLGGGLALGLLIAAVCTYARRGGTLEAAIEVDRRLQLKERVSSALSLEADQWETPIGQALIRDATRRVERLDVRDSFPLRADWRGLLPLLPAAVIFVLALFVPNAVPSKPAQAATGPAAEAERVSRSAQELRKRLALVQKKAEEKGLEDADLIFKQLQQDLQDLAEKSDMARKDALVRMSDVAKDLEKRREQLAGADQMRNQLNRLKDLQQGPADKIAQAMKEGDLQKAIDELKALQERLKNDQLEPAEKQQLAKQLEQLRNKLQEAVDAHEQAKRDLQEQIKRKMAAGDMDGAGQLQRKLDQMNQMNDAVDRMQQMAESLNQCQQCLKDGQGAEAAAQLDQLAQSLQELQESLDELETLDQIMDEIAMAKESMGCKQCGGEGCEGCQGQFGMGRGQGDGMGMGLGEGQGRGPRPEEQTDSGFYESQVRGKVQPGAAVVTGTSSGANRAGKSLAEIRQEISSTLNEEADPLTDVRLPRSERDHTRQYFERLRQGE